MLNIGDKAPEFSLPDQAGVSHSLKSYKPKWILLYFYPKDDTPGCTTEACSLRDNLAGIKKYQAIVLGVSADPIEKHQKFSEKYGLNFPILADPGHETLIAYGAWGPKKFMGRSYEGISRISYLINPEGKIAKVYPKVKPAEHVAEILADLKTLTK